MSTNLVHPSVIWAQRKDVVYLTICLDDVQDPEIKIEPNSLYFKGKGGSDRKEHEANIELYEAVDPTSPVQSISVKPRHVEFTLKKKEDASWPRLTKMKGKIPWLKIDFGKWKDEEDGSDDEGGKMPGMGGMGGGDVDFQQMMAQMGMGGMGGGMEGMGMDKPGLDDLNHETDSDDEDIPDLE